MFLLRQVIKANPVPQLANLKRLEQGGLAQAKKERACRFRTIDSLGRGRPAFPIEVVEAGDDGKSLDPVEPEGKIEA